MNYIKDFEWEEGMSVSDAVEKLGDLGLQASNLCKARDVILKMKRNSANIFLSFTSNMVSSGMRGLFAQAVRLGLPSVVVTTAGAVEEDIMKSLGEKFSLGSFDPDDIELHEQGVNRVGNIMIENESYAEFEDFMKESLHEVYEKRKNWAVSELLKELGSKVEDENSILRQAYEKDIPVFCPGITDGSIGFQLHLFQQKKEDFSVNVVEDFGNILLSTSMDKKKGVVALGGGISKHHAILSTMLSGGAEYAVYVTTSQKTSGSISGATTDEAKSWGKIKDDSNAVTVTGDASVVFPLIISSVFEKLEEEGLIKDG